LDNSLGGLSLPKKTGDSGDSGDDITEGRIIAVEICSEVLQAHIWLAFDDNFNPGDGQAVFYANEIPLLKNKDPVTLREIHKTKLAYGSGSRVSRGDGKPVTPKIRRKAGPPCRKCGEPLDLDEDGYQYLWDHNCSLAGAAKDEVKKKAED
jgi:hypothetical protein